MTKPFSNACEKIKAEYKKEVYQKEGHALGWRFLMCPADRLNAKPQIALLTLNPGGGSSDKQRKCEPSCENGSAYVCESWCGKHPGEAPLQKQIRKLFEAIAAKVGREGKGDKLLKQSLAACYIPFRSPSLNDLPNRKAAKDFANKLWRDLFTKLDPLLIVTIDRITTKAISQILEKKLKCPAPDVTTFKIGWGAVSADVITFKAGKRKRVILRLPHLSRFQLFGRKKGAEKQVKAVIAFAVSASSLPKRAK
jgi:hypothetical protein